MLVMKFGGSSVGAADRIERVRGIVARFAAQRPVVVVSAFRGVTDDLLALARQAQSGKVPDLAFLRKRHEEVISGLELDGRLVEGLLAEVILSVGDGTVTAIITANAARELQLKRGETAAALIKSTDVMIERLD